MAKYLASEWGFEAADRALQVHGGFGYAREFDVERYWREVRLMRIAPITQEMVLNFIGQHELGLPKPGNGESGSTACLRAWCDRTSSSREVPPGP
jgi:alkylation response protein AidB-like acyl-CoA dehydrogenase